MKFLGFLFRCCAFWIVASLASMAGYTEFLPMLGITCTVGLLLSIANVIETS